MQIRARPKLRSARAASGRSVSISTGSQISELATSSQPPNASLACSICISVVPTGFAFLSGIFDYQVNPPRISLYPRPQTTPSTLGQPPRGRDQSKSGSPGPHRVNLGPPVGLATSGLTGSPKPEMSTLPWPASERVVVVSLYKPQADAFPGHHKPVKQARNSGSIRRRRSCRPRRSGLSNSTYQQQGSPASRRPP
jgi:hypothetical protein